MGAARTTPERTTPSGHSTAYSGELDRKSASACRIRGVIFDLDGVIADSHAVHERAWRALLEEAGQRVSAPDLSKIIRQGKARKQILEALFPSSSAEQLTTLGHRKDVLYYENAGCLRPVSGVLEWVQELSRRSFPLAVATSASRPRTLDTLRRFQLENLFHSVVTSSEIATGKPDPALFLAAAKALNIEPFEALVVEDSQCGVEAAKTASMRCVLYSPAGDEVDWPVQPDYVVPAFTRAHLSALFEWIDVDSQPVVPKSA
jgi:beta-phosphoglucomutase